MGRWSLFDYLNSKPNLADKIILMGSDFDEDLRNFENLEPGHLVRWNNGIEPYQKEFFPASNFPLKPIIKESFDRVFTNTNMLVQTQAMRRYTQLLKEKDLSNVVFVYGKFDEANGRTNPAELKFLQSKGVEIVETYGDHHSMFTEIFMTNLYQYLMDGQPLKEVGCRFLSSCN